MVRCLSCSLYLYPFLWDLSGSLSGTVNLGWKIDADVYFLTCFVQFWVVIQVLLMIVNVQLVCSSKLGSRIVSPTHQLKCSVFQWSLAIARRVRKPVSSSSLSASRSFQRVRAPGPPGPGPWVRVPGSGSPGPGPRVRVPGSGSPAPGPRVRVPGPSG